MACSKADAEKCLKEAFNAIDTDHSGTIEGKEIEAVLVAYHKSKGKPHDSAKLKKEVQSFLNDCYKNHDNKVSQDEFLKYFMQLYQ